MLQSVVSKNVPFMTVTATATRKIKDNHNLFWSFKFSIKVETIIIEASLGNYYAPFNVKPQGGGGGGGREWGGDLDIFI